MCLCASVLILCHELVRVLLRKVPALSDPVGLSSFYLCIFISKFVAMRLLFVKQVVVHFDITLCLCANGLILCHELVHVLKRVPALSDPVGLSSFCSCICIWVGQVFGIFLDLREVFFLRKCCGLS